MFPLSFTAATQVGPYFAGQYYEVLRQQPESVHQFYSDVSTMVRINADTREAASGILQIHRLIMSLHYTEIEINTVHSLKSWNGGVLVVVSGAVHVKDFNGIQKFVQTFFLAPHEKGLFVLNDIFHFVDEERILQHPVAYLGQTNLDVKPHTSAATRAEVSNNYVLDGEIHARDFVSPAMTEENGAVNNYDFAEQRPQHYDFTEQRPQHYDFAEQRPQHYDFAEQRPQHYDFVEQRPQHYDFAEKQPQHYDFAEQQQQQVLEDNFAVLSNGSIPSMDAVEDQFSAAAIEEPVGEPQKHTYASIVAKVQSVQAAPPHSSLNKSASRPSEGKNVAESSSQLAFEPPNTLERSGAVVAEDFAEEDELEMKSVYVRNVPKTMKAFEIEAEFKKFGKIKHDGVAIKTRKDVDVRYAFVEFEDATSVQNAIQAYNVQIGGNQLYIEGRRPNRNNFYRGGISGRGGGYGYQSEGRDARNGSRGFSRVYGQDR